MITLKHGDFVRSASWYSHITATVGTVAGYAAENKASVAEYVERAVRLGHELAYTVNTGSCLYGDRGAAEAARKIEMAQVAVAYTLATGDEVMIEGVKYVVRYAPRNEKGNSPVNSDPIHFVRV